MKTYRVFVGLGSNMGKRELQLNNATHALQKLEAVKVIWTSSIYETDPFGKVDQPRFLNAVVELETTLAPEVFYPRLKAIEQELGRTVSERWGPREIDIDILIYDGHVHDDGNVTVPHPEMEQRKFVLVPLNEIAPDLVHPVNGMTVAEMMAACRDTGRVVKSLHHIKL
ncbi:MAG: folK [Bacteroidetes bacterium]|nr:folK [Bacteroidota bacterium]